MWGSARVLLLVSLTLSVLLAGSQLGVLQGL